MRTPMVVCVSAAVTLTACVTVNIYIPAPEVRRAAEEIVDETWGDTALHRGSLDDCPHGSRRDVLLRPGGLDADAGEAQAPAHEQERVRVDRVALSQCSDRRPGARGNRGEAVAGMNTVRRSGGCPRGGYRLAVPTGQSAVRVADPTTLSGTSCDWR